MLWIYENIKLLGEKECIKDSFGVFSYLDLAQKIEENSKIVKDFVYPGEIVAIHADYNFYSIAMFFALIQHKCIIVPIVSQNKKEVEGRIRIANCSSVVKFNGKNASFQKVEAKQAHAQHDLVTTLVSDRVSGLILFSSGSTGEPKAMIHNLDRLINTFEGKRHKNLNMLVFLMFDHIGGLNTLFNTLSIGATIILPENRSPEYIGSLIAKHKINVLPATPTFLNMLLLADSSSELDLSSLKMITYGTEPMPESLLLKLKERFPKTRLMQTFGTSETGIVQASSRSSGSLEMKLNDPNIEYKIVDNELWLKSKTQIMGYLNTTMESFTEDGWFKTGDMVETSKDGHIKIIGRLKEVINVGGEKVLPAEVESIVMELDFVGDCTAFGQQNALTGQMVAVDILLTEDMSEKDAKKAIRSHCKSKLDNFKVPAKFRFVDSTNASERFKKIRLKK
ncbi:MAG: o-succinylbenzoate--CoA ligase [Halobacteriovoraceae bacterium]|nr:o-succinylbenzoate--CoA ligase [Halobacteriovoraceae bacterium]